MLEPDLAYASSTYRELAARATAMAGTAPLTPAAYRDATGTSRKFVMAILEDLDRRGILRRTDAGHVPGPRAATGLGPSPPMTATETVAVIVLAGGRSSRFGRDKLAEPVDGRPLLDHAIDAARRVTTEVLVVVAPGSAPAVPAGVQVVHDAQAYEGPLAGVAAGLAATDADIVVVVAGDMPAIVPGVLERLVAAMTAGRRRTPRCSRSAMIGRRSRWRFDGQRR